MAADHEAALHEAAHHEVAHHEAALQEAAFERAAMEEVHVPEPMMHHIHEPPIHTVHEPVVHEASLFEEPRFTGYMHPGRLHDPDQVYITPLHPDFMPHPQQVAPPMMTTSDYTPPAHDAWFTQPEEYAVGHDDPAVDFATHPLEHDFSLPVPVHQQPALGIVHHVAHDFEAPYAGDSRYVLGDPAVHVETHQIHPLE